MIQEHPLTFAAAAGLTLYSLYLYARIWARDFGTTSTDMELQFLVPWGPDSWEDVPSYQAVQELAKREAERRENADEEEGR